MLRKFLIPNSGYYQIKDHLERDELVITITTRKLNDYDLATSLRNEMLAALQRSGKINVIVDLQFVQFIASVGLLAFLTLSRNARDLGGRMILCNIPPNIAKVFFETRLLILGRPEVSPFAHAKDLSGAIELLQDNSAKQ